MILRAGNAVHARMEATEIDITSSEPTRQVLLVVLTDALLIAESRLDAEGWQLLDLIPLKYLCYYGKKRKREYSSFFVLCMFLVRQHEFYLEAIQDHRNVNGSLSDYWLDQHLRLFSTTESKDVHFFERVFLDKQAKSRIDGTSTSHVTVMNACA